MAHYTIPLSAGVALVAAELAPKTGFVLRARMPGTAGNAITFAVASTATGAPTISVAGNAITLAYDPAGAGNIGTYAEIKELIEASEEANALVEMRMTALGTTQWAKVVSAAANLTGGTGVMVDPPETMPTPG